MFSSAQHLHRKIPTSSVVRMLDSGSVRKNVSLVNGTSILHALQEYELGQNADDNNTCSALVLSPDLTQVVRLYISCTVSYYASFLCFSETEQISLKRGTPSESYELMKTGSAYLLRPPSVVCRKHEVLVNGACHILVLLNIPKLMDELVDHFRQILKGQSCEFRVAAKCWATLALNYSTTLEGKHSQCYGAP